MSMPRLTMLSSSSSKKKLRPARLGGAGAAASKGICTVLGAGIIPAEAAVAIVVALMGAFATDGMFIRSPEAVGKMGKTADEGCCSGRKTSSWSDTVSMLMSPPMMKSSSTSLLPVPTPFEMLLPLSELASSSSL